VDIQGPGVVAVIDPPHPLEQLVARDDLAGPRHEYCQDPAADWSNLEQQAIDL
jgi:hypothetical protein